jgi:hypothetical protein
MAHLRTRISRAAVAAPLAVSLLGLSACGQDEAEAGTNGSAAESSDTSIEDIQEDGPGTDNVYDGSYDSAFMNNVTSYEGEHVTVTGEVAEIISEKAFTIGSTDGTDVEPLIVIYEDPVADLAFSSPVTVSGVVHKAFNVAVAEDQLDTELDKVTFSDWESQPYIEAGDVEVTEPQD